MQKLNREDQNLARKGAATDFNILVCGAAGIGKSSFVELFIKKFNLTEANKIIKEQKEEPLPSNEDCSRYNKYIIKKPTDSFEEKNISSSSDKDYP